MGDQGLVPAFANHSGSRAMAEQLNFTVDFEDGVFVARCIELDITTDGLTKGEAIENLKEALNCYFANPDERLDRRLRSEDDEDEAQ
jgi:predicted RNase H-like HicB family nuclease